MKQNASSLGNTYSISDDGRIRLRLAELRAVHLMHLISGLDEDIPGSVSGGALPTTITGYTEWVSDTIPVITIGWDWQMHDSSRLLRVGEPRSNLILQDVLHMDVDYYRAMVFLEEFVDALDWQWVVMNQITTRYSWQ